MARTMKQRLLPLLDFIRYAGNARTCPICGKSARRFLPYGTIQRPDARCPFCDSIERHRFFWLYLQRRTDLLTNPPKKALHIAPEQSLERKLRPLFGDGYLTADLLEPNVDMKMDIMDIPFPDGTFDFIYCSHVLEHVPDDRKAMREFYRLLTPNGIAVLPVPIAVEVTDEDPSITDPKERLRRFLLRRASQGR